MPKIVVRTVCAPVTTLLLTFGRTTFCKMSRLINCFAFLLEVLNIRRTVNTRREPICFSPPLFRSFLCLWTTVHVNTTAHTELTAGRVGTAIGHECISFTCTVRTLAQYRLQANLPLNGEVKVMENL